MECEIREDEWEPRIYQGLMPIGELGCGSYAMLVVTGIHAGRVVYINLQTSKPVFTKHSGFLD